MTYQATDIAKYIINKCTIEKHAISNLQLQEILYYIQKEFLEIGLKAFEDDFEAWPSGPVIPEVCNKKTAAPEQAEQENEIPPGKIR